MSGAVELAVMLRDLVDVLLPGDAEWPSGSAAGTHGMLGARLLETRGEAGVEALDRALRQSSAPFGDRDEAGRIAVVQTLERDFPALFAHVRMIVYVSYYENPAVIRAIRTLGQPYDPLSGPHGYALPPFAIADRPTHGRGAWVPTDAVARVDLAGLSHLGGAA
jgi:hypothetical protein